MSQCEFLWVDGVAGNVKGPNVSVAEARRIKRRNSV